MDEIVQEFLVESRENLEQYDRDLLEIENNPGSAKALDSVFRTVHTIKGTCGFLGFAQLERITHAAENVLSQLRDGTLQPQVSMVTTLLGLGDELRVLLDGIEDSGAEPERDHKALLEDLARLSREPGATEVETAEPPPAAAAALATDSQDRDELPTGSAEREGSAAKPARPVQTTRTARPEVNQTQATSSSRQTRSEQTIRVDTQTLDELMNLVGELVLARNQTLQFVDRIDDSSFLKATQRLDAITSELQEGIMKTRMQPLSILIGKFPRVARDLAIALGKQVELSMVGGDTELDRTILEAIKDPLTHVVRNAIDHGIESPFEREAAGKHPTGTVSLRASHLSGKVIIEIEDDGRGLDPKKILSKSLQKHLVEQAQAETMSEQEIARLIFRPGFSTADSVTNLSGRGVGMDVVKTNIEKIGGSIDLENRPGNGMTLRLKIPLTLAIIPALIVSCAGERYAIPQASLVELLRLDAGRVATEFEDILNAKVYRLRDKLLPIVWLGEVLKEGPALESVKSGDDVQIVVMQADGQQFGVVVDDINDNQEIVVKPLGSVLTEMMLFSGATILGDGSIALIINGMGLAKQAGVLAQLHANKRQKSSQLPAPTSAHPDSETLLLFGVHEGGRMAVPLKMVARLEEFPVSIIERVGDRDVVQYRDDIMPLIRVADVIPERRSTPRGVSDLSPDPKKLSVLVYAEDGRCVGLVVDRILDIVEEGVLTRRSIGRPGTLGSAVIQGRVTELLDIVGIVDSTLQTQGRLQ